MRLGTHDAAQERSLQTVDCSIAKVDVPDDMTRERGFHERLQSRSDGQLITGALLQAFSSQDELAGLQAFSLKQKIWEHVS